jgi:hypothetical protein
MARNNLIAFTGFAHAKPMQCGGDLTGAIGPMPSKCTTKWISRISETLLSKSTNENSES